MSAATVSQNYAEVLFVSSGKAGQREEYGRLMQATARGFAMSPEAQAVLVSPKVSKTAKGELIGRSLVAAGAPQPFVLFLQAVVKRGRQGLLTEISQAYNDMVDGQLGRVRATVTVARDPEPTLEETIVASLSKTLGKGVLATFMVEPEILGGTIVKVGDRVYDGSIRRKLVRLKRQLLSR